MTFTVRSAGGTGPAGPFQQPERSPITEWSNSERAQPYQGQWVLLDGQLEPRDSDLSVLALQRRHVDEADGVIVFVPATTVFLGV